MATKQEAMERMGEVPLLSSCSQNELETIFRQANVVKYADGTEMAIEGKKGFGFHLIMEGKAKVVRGGRTITTLGPGDFFGEMSFIDDSPRSASIVADGPIESLVVPGWEFKPIVRNNPGLAWKLIVHLTGRLREEQSARDEATA